MSQFIEGLLVGASVSWALALTIGMWLSERDHREWCRMFDRLYSIVGKLAERVTRPDDASDWWKSN